MKHFEFIKRAFAEGYKVTADGKVINKRGTISKPFLNSGGYLVQTLRAGGIPKGISVHQIVFVWFYNKDSISINHKNCIKTDNRPENLEDSDAFRQMQHAYKMGRMVYTVGEINGMSKLTCKDVRKIRALLKTSIMQKDIAAKFKVSRSTITKIKKGENWGKII